MQASFSSHREDKFLNWVTCSNNMHISRGSNCISTEINVHGIQTTVLAFSSRDHAYTDLGSGWFLLHAYPLCYIAKMDRTLVRFRAERPSQEEAATMKSRFRQHEQLVVTMRYISRPFRTKKLHTSVADHFDSGTEFTGSCVSYPRILTFIRSEAKWYELNSNVKKHKINGLARGEGVDKQQ